MLSSGYKQSGAEYTSCIIKSLSSLIFLNQTFLKFEE